MGRAAGHPRAPPVPDPGELDRLSRHDGRRFHRLPDRGSGHHSGGSRTSLLRTHTATAELFISPMTASGTSRPLSRGQTMGCRTRPSYSGCFNQAYKITPEIFACWMRMLQTVPQSVLWLLEDNRWASENLRLARSYTAFPCAPGVRSQAAARPASCALSRSRLSA